MRVSSNSQYVGFTRHVNKIQLERDKAQTRVSTGKDIITLSDNPEKVVDIKLFGSPSVIPIVNHESYSAFGYISIKLGLTPPIFELNIPSV